jgi:hypothetical protein
VPLRRAAFHSLRKGTQTKIFDGVADVDISRGQCKDYRHTPPVKFARTDRLFVYEAFCVAALKAFFFYRLKLETSRIDACSVLNLPSDIENHFQQASR